MSAFDARTAAALEELRARPVDRFGDPIGRGYLRGPDQHARRRAPGAHMQAVLAALPHAFDGLAEKAGLTLKQTRRTLERLVSKGAARIDDDNVVRRIHQEDA